MITTNSPKWQALKLTLKDQREIKGGSIIIEEDMVI